MNCTEVEELAGAFVLGAIAAEESAAVAKHLADCPDAHRLVSELTEVVGHLPFLVEDVEPPQRLRRNLIAAALASEGTIAPLATPVATTIAEQTATQRLAVVPRESPALRPVPTIKRRIWLSPSLLAAAAMLIAAVGLGIWNLDLQRRLDGRSVSGDQKAVLNVLASGGRVVPLVSANGVQAQLVRPRDHGTAYVIGTLPPPPAGKAYQAWILRDGQATSAGVFKASGFTVIPLNGDLQGAQLLTFTLEPEAGSETPTLPVVAQAPVS